MYASDYSNTMMQNATPNMSNQMKMAPPGHAYNPQGNGGFQVQQQQQMSFGYPPQQQQYGLPQQQQQHQVLVLGPNGVLTPATQQQILLMGNTLGAHVPANGPAANGGYYGGNNNQHMMMAPPQQHQYGGPAAHHMGAPPPHPNHAAGSHHHHNGHHQQQQQPSNGRQNNNPRNPRISAVPQPRSTVAGAVDKSLMLASPHNGLSGGGAAGDDPVVAAYRSTPEAERGFFTLDTILGHVVPFANDPDGSRGLQRMISEASGLLTTLTRKGTVDMPTVKPPRVAISPYNLQRLRGVFAEIEPRLQDVIFSTYGNFVVQKFIETQCCEFIVAVAGFCKGKAVAMAKDDFGCRILQNLVETQLMDGVSTIVAPHVIALVTELSQPADEEIHAMIVNQNANHVLQRCMTFFPQETSFVAVSVLPRFTDLAKHVYGSRVIQCIFEQLKAPHVRPEDETRALLMMYLSLEHFDVLVNTQYGNFAVTHALVNSPAEDADMSHIKTQLPFPPTEIRRRIIDTILPNIINLASSKFASNVAQRVFQFSNDQQQAQFMALLQQPQSRAGTPNIVALMMDQYANYVMQDVLLHCTDAQKAELMKTVRPFLAQISRSQFGRHIVGKVLGTTHTSGAIGGGGGRNPKGAHHHAMGMVGGALHPAGGAHHGSHPHHLQQQPQYAAPTAANGAPIQHIVYTNGPNPTVAPTSANGGGAPIMVVNGIPMPLQQYTSGMAPAGNGGNNALQYSLGPNGTAYLPPQQQQQVVYTSSNGATHRVILQQQHQGGAPQQYAGVSTPPQGHQQVQYAVLNSPTPMQQHHQHYQSFGTTSSTGTITPPNGPASTTSPDNLHHQQPAGTVVNHAGGVAAVLNASNSPNSIAAAGVPPQYTNMGAAAKVAPVGTAPHHHHATSNGMGNNNNEMQGYIESLLASMDPSSAGGALHPQQQQPQLQSSPSGNASITSANHQSPSPYFNQPTTAGWN